MRAQYQKPFWLVVDDNTGVIIFIVIAVKYCATCVVSSVSSVSGRILAISFVDEMRIVHLGRASLNPRSEACA